MEQTVEERIDELIQETPDLLPEVVHNILYEEGHITLTVKDVKKYLAKE